MSMEAINSINRKINDTRAQIEFMTNACKEPSDIVRFSLEELNRRLEDLIEQRKEIYNAQAKETVKLRLYGESIESGKISNRILVSVLGGFQSILESIAVISVGSMSTRGKFSDSAKMITDFKVTGTFAGSFGIVLEKDCGQMELTRNSTKTGIVMQNLFDILENSGDSTQLINHICPYGKRTIKHYRKWLKGIKNEGVNLEMNWIDDSAEIRHLNINHTTVDDIIYTLDSIDDISNEEVKIKGILTGLNIRQNTFELKVEDTIIKGTSKLETLIKLSSMLGNEIQVLLIKSTLQSPNYVSKITWYLEDIIEETIGKK